MTDCKTDRVIDRHVDRQTDYSGSKVNSIDRLQTKT